MRISRDYHIRRTGPGAGKQRRNPTNKEIFPEEFIREHWANGKPISHKGKLWEVHRMSYGQYFLEPQNYRTSERRTFHPNTKWLERIPGKPGNLQIER